MKHHVMLDLETLGNEPYAALLSIGACKFNPNNPGEIADSFHVCINPEFENPGLRLEPSTVIWWMHEDQTEARKAWFEQVKVTAPIALDGFADWLGGFAPDIEDRVIWGNGAAFDNVLLSCAYKAAQRDVPWKFYNDRCFRTMKSWVGAKAVEPEFEGVKHHALWDARHQAKWLQNIVAATGFNLT